MTINTDSALAMARLARLDLGAEPADLTKLAEDFDRIVAYMDILAEAETAGIEPMYSPMENTAGPRPDEVLEPEGSAGKAELILEQAPERVGRFFSVPRIF
ncbi:MAG: Asp-tRNA(Asn)/Glu-tRNA(Gln) amidotransferase subunit GatC [Deltaproteobacteria bacterium]|jgi:aspartyl-tRNA(Asn)/glutamyl-tRNA(Gln) amidotransferase subunit C|nr:Asp-tRNA(Asn)/Glu-tRNA(Gln) amidotransferase subunit GatC [Deltaproteobacteria bacterium]